MIIASGAAANWLGLPSEEKFKNHGVSACAVCEGALPRFRHKPIVVVGGGDSACEEANFLSKYADRVHMVYRKGRADMPASPIMAERTMNNPKVTPHWHSVVDEVLGTVETGMTGVRIKHAKTGETQTIDAAGLFVAIGHTPNTKFLNGQLELDTQGFIKLLDPSRSLTSVRGRVRRRRRGRPDVQAGDHRRRHGVQGGHGRRAVAGGGRDAQPESADAVAVGLVIRRSISPPLCGGFGRLGYHRPTPAKRGANGGRQCPMSLRPVGTVSPARIG